MTTKKGAEAQVKPLQVSSVREWHRARVDGIMFQFPSGLIARVRPMNMSAFLKIGNIPDMLTHIVAKMVNGTVNIESMAKDDYLKSLELMDAFTKAAFIEPVVVDVVKDESKEIQIDDISDVDKQTLFSFIGAPASLLESFRPFQEQPVADMVSSEGDTPDAE